MPYDSDYREAAVGSLDTETTLSEQGGDSPGSFDVPANAKTLTEILVALGVIAADVVTGTTCAVRLSGSGIAIGEGYFPGPMVSLSGAAAKSDSFGIGQGMRYKTRIPVKGGGKIKATGFIHGEDPGTAHLLVQLVYDGFPGRIVDCDYREIQLGGSANTLTTLTLRGDTTEGDFKPAYAKIGEVIFGATMDPAGDTAGEVFAPALHLSGPGLLVSGNYKFLGPAGGLQPDAADVSGRCQVINPHRFITDIQTKINNAIRAQAQNIESAVDGSAIVGLAYV